MKDCCRKTRDEILASFQEAEKVDARHGLVLPGDCALSVVLWSLESAKGDEERSE